MSEYKFNICTPLPGTITNQISTCRNSEQYITNYLQNLLPSSDSKAIENELKKNFIFSKQKISQARRSKRRGKLLSNKKRMELGLRNVGSEYGMKYNDLLPLNDLWLKYMKEMLGEKFFKNIPQDPLDPNWESVNQQLMKADFHGAEILVIQSKCPSLVGQGGIIIQDTKNAFRICGKDNRIRTIPKDVIIMNIHLGQNKLELFGKEISIKPTERTVKKFKAARAFEL